MASLQGIIEFFALPRVTYGIPAAEALAMEADRLGARRVGLIVSRTLKETTDEIAKIERALGEQHAGTFTGIPPHAPESSVLTMAAAVREAKPDLLVSIGGGSVNDATKALLSCLDYGITTLPQLAEHRARWENGRPLPAAFPPPKTPMIAVPITLSASEFAPMGGLTDEATNIKNTYGHRKLRVETVIFDPRVARHTPEQLWISTGVKAIDHAAEALGSLRSNDLCDGIAASALRLLSEGLTAIKADPDDDAARLKCQLASWQASMPLAHTPMALSHALGYVLGSIYHVPHGTTSCVTLPAVFAWNSKVNADRQARVSECLGRPGEPASHVLRELIGNLEMPLTLRDIGIRKHDLAAIAEKAIVGSYIPANPRPIGSTDDILEVLEIAY